MTTKLNTLLDGLLNEVKDLYSAEHQLLKALPNMEKKATNKKLKEAIHTHSIETKGQVERLDEIGKLMEEKLSGKTCKAMQGLLEEGDDVMKEECENSALLDALLIGAAQRVEHYEIAAYSTAHAMAIELGQNNIATLLEKTLKEEMNASKKLSSISKEEVLSEANRNSSIDAEKHTSKPASQHKSQNDKKAGNFANIVGLIACLVLSLQRVPSALADTPQSIAKNETESKSYSTDNAGRNVRDRSEARLTADDQNLGGKDLDVLARIRSEVVANEKLSTNAHNVKIVVKDGKVVLRGPVTTEKERIWIENASARIAGGYSVVNQLEISP